MQDYEDDEEIDDQDEADGVPDGYEFTNRFTGSFNYKNEFGL